MESPEPKQSNSTIGVANLCWYLFLIWTLIGAFVMPFGIDAQKVAELTGSEQLATWANAVLQPADAIWMILAFAVVYLHISQVYGLLTARLWGAVILIGSGVIEAVGAMTGWPFGPYHYTDNMGIRLFGVLPFTIPLAWFVIIATAQAVIDFLRPDWNRIQKASFVGVVATATDINLEIIAWKVREYWIWYPESAQDMADLPGWPPLQNFISWFSVAFLLSLALVRSKNKPVTFPLRPALLLLLMNALFLLVHLVRWLFPA